MKKRYKTLFFILYIIFGLYFLNYPFQIVEIPESFLEIEQWIIFIGGILILAGAVGYFRPRKKYNLY